jgi:hypothetical protein
VSRTGWPRTILDADVIYSRVLHELMGARCGRLARAGPQRIVPCDALGDGDEL